MNNVELNKFRRSLFRGTGLAILELQKKPDPRYQKSVLYACTHLTLYHGQDEPSREKYLYKALSYFKNDHYFFEKITHRLFATRDLSLTIQLVGILILFDKNKFKSDMVTVLEARLDDYFEKLPQENWENYHDGRECAEHIMIMLYELTGIESFWITLKKLNQAIKRYVGDQTVSPLFYDQYIDDVLKSLKITNGKNLIAQYKIDNPDIINILENYDYDNAVFHTNNYHKDIKEPDITFEYMIKYYKKIGYLPFTFIRKYLKHHDQQDLIKLANQYLIDSPNEQYVIMCIFTQVNFPLDPTLLLAYYNMSSDIDHKAKILEALSRFKGKFIRDLAIHNLSTDQYYFESLMLLQHNLKQTDISLLLEILKNYNSSKDPYDFHGLAMEIIHIMKENPTIDFNLLYPILIDRGRCAECRSYLIETLCNNQNKLRQIELIKICLEDCNESTQNLAKSLLKTL